MDNNVTKFIMVALTIGILGVGSITAVQQMSYSTLNTEYQDLLTEYEDFDALYAQAIEDYETAYGQYEAKVAEYEQLNITYTVLLSTHSVLMESCDELAQTLEDTSSQLVSLNQTYLNLLGGFEALNITYYILMGDYDVLDATLQTLIDQYSALNMTYYNLVDAYDFLSTMYDSLSTSYDQLVAEHAILQADYDQLLIDYDALETAYGVLLASYTQLQADYDALQSDYDSLWLNYNTLWAAHQALQVNYDNLQDSYDTLQSQYDILLMNYNTLEQDYLVLQSEYDILNLAYIALQSQYDTCQLELSQLQLDYDALNISYWVLDASHILLQADFDLLQQSYDMLATWIRQSILPVQYGIFAEAVRRYYFEDFYVQNKIAEGNITGYWSEFTRFCRDVILHDSSSVYDDTIYPQFTPPYGQPDIWFGDVSNALANVLTPYGPYGNDTCVLAARCLAHILDDNGLVYFGWDGRIITGAPLTDIGIIIDQCNTAIDYEYDSILPIDREPYDWDYIKFPVETAFRTMGDCEDQAMLAAAYLESCGFEAMMVVIHDPTWNAGAGLYHGVLMVWWDTLAWGAMPSGTWGFGFASDGAKYDNGLWMFLDTTWDTPFGTDPAWLQWYEDTGISQVFNYQYFNYAVCDIGGWVSYEPTI